MIQKHKKLKLESISTEKSIKHSSYCIKSPYCSAEFKLHTNPGNSKWFVLQLLLRIYEVFLNLCDRFDLYRKIEFVLWKCFRTFENIKFPGFECATVILFTGSFTQQNKMSNIIVLIDFYGWTDYLIEVYWQMTNLYDLYAIKMLMRKTQ